VSSKIITPCPSILLSQRLLSHWNILFHGVLH